MSTIIEVIWWIMLDIVGGLCFYKLGVYTGKKKRKKGRRMKLLLYCTKAKPYLFKNPTNIRNQFIRDYWCANKLDEKPFDEDILNGKIVAECDFEVEEIKCVDDGYFVWYEGKTLDEYKLLEQSCLNETELFDYLQSKFGYAIHIKNLHIFDKPRELSEFVTKRCQYAICSSCRYGKDNVKCSTIDNEVDKAPQNMMCCYGVDGKRYVLISVRPQWLCKILNGEKTIEVRKKVLKEMLK